MCVENLIGGSEEWNLAFYMKFWTGEERNVVPPSSSAGVRDFVQVAAKFARKWADPGPRPGWSPTRD